MARERHVFPTSEVPHKWAHQTQHDGRNPQNNLYFRGDTIYSYRDSWPLARIYRHAKRGALVLSNSDKYSTTTAQHQGEVNRAVGHMRRIAVPHCRRDLWTATDAQQDAANVACLERLAADELAKAQRAQQARTVEWRRDAAAQALADAAEYRRFFGLRGKVAAMPAAEWAAALARAQRIESPDPASKDKRERASAARKARLEARERAALENFHLHCGAARSAWRLGEPLRMPAHPLAKGRRRWQYRVESGPVMLRVNGEEIETSQGARIPAAAAPAVWAAVQRTVARGAAYTPSGLGGMKIGDYAVEEIGADGTLRVGCHTIPHAELRSMARQLNLA